MKFFITLFILLINILSLSADTVVLNNGNINTGEFLDYESGEFAVLITDKIYSYDINKINSIKLTQGKEYRLLLKDKTMPVVKPIEITSGYLTTTNFKIAIDNVKAMKTVTPASSSGFNDSQKLDEGIVIVYSLNVRQKPNNNRKIIFQVYKGNKIKILKYYNNKWAKIKTVTGGVGFLDSSFLNIKRNLVSHVDLVSHNVQAKKINTKIFNNPGYYAVLKDKFDNLKKFRAELKKDLIKSYIIYQHNDIPEIYIGAYPALSNIKILIKNYLLNKFNKTELNNKLTVRKIDSTGALLKSYEIDLNDYYKKKVESYINSISFPQLVDKIKLTGPLFGTDWNENYKGKEIVWTGLVKNLSFENNKLKYITIQNVYDNKTNIFLFPDQTSMIKNIIQEKNILNRKILFKGILGTFSYSDDSIYIGVSLFDFMNAQE